MDQIHQDEKGFIWIGSTEGLFRFDGYATRTFFPEPDNENSLKYYSVTSLFEDSRGELWIGNHNVLSWFDRRTETFIHYSGLKDDKETPLPGIIYSIAEDRLGRIWITAGYKVYRVDLSTRSFIPVENVPGRIRVVYRSLAGDLLCGGESLYRYDEEEDVFTDILEADFPGRVIRVIYGDDTTLYLGSNDGVIGEYSVSTGEMKSYYVDREKKELLITSIVKDSWGDVWAGTNGSGLARIRDGVLLVNRHDPDDPLSIQDDSIASLFTDRQDILWIGYYYVGIGHYVRNSFRYTRYLHEEGSELGLNSNNICTFYKDREDTIWIGTSVPGLHKLSPGSREPERITHLADGTPLDLSYSVTVVEDNRGRLWFATWASGLSVYDPLNNTLKTYLYNPDDMEDSRGLSGPNLQGLLYDSQGILWIGTNNGLDRFDIEKEEFIHYFHDSEDPDSLSISIVTSIHEDGEGQIWLSHSHGGISVLDKESEKFSHFRSEPGKPGTLSSDKIWDLSIDEHYVWAAAENALNRIDLYTGSVKVYDARRGLPGRGTVNIVEDHSGDLWIGGSPGMLLKFNKKSEVFKRYSRDEGFPLKGFVVPSYVTENRDVFFGSYGQGLLSINTGDFSDYDYKPRVVISDFYLFNSLLSPGHPLLSHTIEETDVLNLSYRQSVLSFEVAVLNYRHPLENQFRYTLEGFDSEWYLSSGKRRLITYTNLAPGKYTLKIKGANNDGVWSSAVKELDIVVSPPLWKSWWAYLFYLIFLILVIMSWFRYSIRKKEKEFLFSRRELQREKELTSELKRLNRLKDDFLANTSHELRTPLHGMIGISESLMDGAAGTLSPEVEYNLSLVVGSGKRLMTLINDLLDFSRLKEEQIEIERKPVDIRQVADIVLSMCQPLVKNKELKLVNLISDDFTLVRGDENRLEQVLYNLVGNAVKFTVRGQITVSGECRGEYAWISVRDTGVGISQDNIKRIFNAFEQVDGSVSRHFGGTGLGLTISKKLIERHGGVLDVNSVPGEGSTFTFSIPVSDKSLPLERAALFQQTVSHLKVSPVQVPSESAGYRILVVDDEEVNLQVLMNHISLAGISVDLCTNGFDALNRVQESSYDMVIADLMMPGMSGYELCARLRENYTATEMPVLILTARSRIEDLLLAFKAGANDYISKPFNKEELMARVQTLLTLKKSVENFTNLEKKILEDRIKSINVLISGIAHEINTPVGVSITSLSYIQEQVGHVESLLKENQLKRNQMAEFFDSLKKSMELIHTGMERASFFVTRLKEMLVFSESHVVSFSLKELLDSVLISLASEIKEAGFQYRVICEDSVVLSGFTGQLSQLLTILVLNTIEHNKGMNCQIVIRAEEVENGVNLYYRDYGKGISSDIVEKIFDPFFTTARREGRMGLGLHIAYTIVVYKLKGSIQYRTSEDGEADFVVFLPHIFK